MPFQVPSGLFGIAGLVGAQCSWAKTCWTDWTETAGASRQLLQTHRQRVPTEEDPKRVGYEMTEELGGRAVPERMAA